MKKIIILFCTAILSISAHAGNIYLRAGLDLNESYKKIYVDNGYLSIGEESKGVSGEIALEYTFDITKKLELGFGIAVQKHGELTAIINTKSDNTPKEEELITATIPVYLTSKYNFITFENNTKFYLKGDVGYFGIGRDKRLYTYEKTRENSFENIYLDFKYTTYVGVGVGVEYNNFIFDVMYKYNTLKFSAEGSRSEFGETANAINLSAKPELKYDRIALSVGYKF